MSASPMAGVESGEKRRERFFDDMAPNYARFTGNTTRNMIDQVLASFSLGLNGYSVVHDNACGAGTATEAVLAWTAARGTTPRVKATDYSRGMIDALDKIVARRADEPGWRNVETEVLNSTKLSTVKDETFTHVFCNFSIFTFDEPKTCLLEIHRTLKPGGITVVTGWKRFPPLVIMGTAQDHIKGDGWVAEHPVPVAGRPFLEEDGYGAKMVDEVGWEKGKTKTAEFQQLVIEGTEDWNGLFAFLITRGKPDAGKDWSDEELAQWEDAVKVGMAKERDTHGGMLFVAWAILARRWDALNG